MTIPGKRLGAYEVLAPLGAGGMGEVYRARDTRLGREVAIKVLPEEVSSDASRLKRFEKEARAASALNHPNIVTIYDIGSADSVSYIAMELVTGKTLREALFGGPLPIKRLLHIAAQLADGLARAHEAGIVHRDLKPENVMVTKDGLVKILDFGLAKLTQVETGSGEGSHLPTETGTSPGAVLGTVGYMSPEQAAGLLVDFRSDQFSFGSILYEMATGKRAFQKGTAVDTLSAILHEEPKPVGEVNPQAPAPLRWIVERCLAKDPEERYGTTKDLARELQAIRDHLSEASLQTAVVATAPRRKGERLLISTVVFLAAIAAGIAIGRLRASPVAPSFRRLTFRSGDLGMARFAPDGQTIVYSATFDAPRSVYLMRIGNPESNLLFPDTDLYAVSDRGELAVMPGGWTRQPNLLARAPLTGGTPREVVENVAWSNADWAPKGEDLAIIRSFGGKNRLEFPIGKVLFETHAVICCPRISPDGRTIAFFESNSLVRTIQTDGAGAAVLSSGWSVIAGVPCWNSRSREIWFTAGKRAEPGGLFGVSRSGRTRAIVGVPGGLELYDISSSGKVLVGHHIQTAMLTWGRTEGDETERDVSWLDWSLGADLSAGGRSILFTEIGEGGGAESAIYLRATDGSPAKRLGEGRALALSPDEKLVLGTRNARLFLLPTGPGQTKSLNGPDLEEVNGGSWTPDGMRVVFSARERGKGPRLYLQPVGDGRPRPISPEGVTMSHFGNSVSPDGRLVIGLPTREQFTQYPEQRGEPRLNGLDGSGPRAIPGLEPGELPVGWSPKGDAVYVHKRVDRPAEVLLLDLATGRKWIWKKIVPPFGVVQGLMIARDGSSYIYNSRRSLSTLELAEGLK